MLEQEFDQGLGLGGEEQCDEAEAESEINPMESLQEEIIYSPEMHELSGVPIDVNENYDNLEI